MNPNDRHIIDRHDLKSNHRPSALSVLRLFAFLFVALSPAIAAARPAVVLGSFTEQSNASAMLETLAERDELAGIALTVAINETRDNAKGQVHFSSRRLHTGPSQTRALLRQLRAAGFTKAWYLSRVALDRSGLEPKSSRATVAATADSQQLRREAAIEYSAPKTAAPVSKAVAADPVSTEIAAKPQWKHRQRQIETVQPALILKPPLTAKPTRRRKDTKTATTKQ